MAKYGIPTNQFEEYRKSVHWSALEKRGDLCRIQAIDPLRHLGSCVSTSGPFLVARRTSRRSSNAGRKCPELGPEHDLPLTAAQFASVLWNHAPRMLGQVREAGVTSPVLQGDEILDLQTFLASLRYFEPTGSPIVGERVFSERGCAHCHGAGGDGTQMGPRLRSGTEALTTVFFATALWKHGPRMIDRAEELNVKWPILEANDIGDLVSFLNTPVPQK